MSEKACKNCRYITTEDKCPVCGSKDLTRKWEGYILIINPEESEIAKEIGAKIPGKYAQKIKY